MRRGFLVLGLVLALPTSASAWEPGPARYEVGVRSNVPVTMSDGTILRADVYYPADPATGEHAKGEFPVLMVQTPYGKNLLGARSGGEGANEAGTQTGPVPYLIKRGYIDVVAEVRGTGASQGTFDLLDPVQSRDGAELVDWASNLPHSNGKVGLYGPSYMGIMQFKTLTALGRDSPVKAIFPIVAANSPYRDLVFSGGMPGIEFDLAFIGLMVGLNTAGPFENPGDLESLLAAQLQHAQGLPSWQASQVVNISTGGDQAYDEAYWQARAPGQMLAKVIENGIPAFLIGGWFDVFQRGEPLNYAGLQNAFSRPARHGADGPAPAGERPLPAAPGTLVPRDRGRRREHLPARARVVRPLAEGRADRDRRDRPAAACIRPWGRPLARHDPLAAPGGDPSALLPRRGTERQRRAVAERRPADIRQAGGGGRPGPGRISRRQQPVQPPDGPVRRRGPQPDLRVGPASAQPVCRGRPHHPVRARAPSPIRRSRWSATR